MLEPNQPFVRFDGDGKLDLVTANLGNGGSVSLLSGLGDCGFNPTARPWCPRRLTG